MGIWAVGISNQYEILILKQNFQKNKAVTGKTPLSAVLFSTLYLSSH